ncbi:MAG: TldD/PmbA family protein [Hydrococcus sp. C42_A2020_068]|uniref:TldD/PmbA family protein n=1 Tax=Pleurocapsa sp. PCC 7327 TaxID=118163 RepID=UPI00029FA0DE|nr:TldD/PmbA family protein [Pleurocapsa sp. PCC 7327]AFY78821.1 putative Zn-dependent protease-like protein [Pleurocapsa sp. PCC 7327]MBF2020320.1 TldD/PmbA family protein [Hydrococcus sp. C42_A2020_068]
MTIDLQKPIDLALKAGASHAEVYHSRALSRPVFFEANRLKQLESSQSEGTALRLWREGCPGLAVAYGEVDPEVLVERAIALSRLNPPETIELAEARMAIYPNVGEEVAVEKLVEIGKNAIAQLRDAYPDLICTAELESERETTILLNSQGLHCEYTDTSVSYFLGVEWVRGEDFLGIYDGEYTRGSLNPDKVVKQILQRLQWAQTNAPPPTGRIPILFTANAATMLWGTAAAALNGKSVLEKSSPWSDKLGELVASEMLTLSQQPDKEPYSCPFDDEGTPTQTLSLISQGRVEQFYTDRTTARALGTQSTGNGFRPGLGRYPTPDLVNLLIEPGKGSLEELIAQLDEGLLVDQMLGGGADLSGDFSINVDLGYRVEGGKIVGRVKDTMVAGNVYTALKKIVALGGDIDWNGSCYTPSLIVQGLSVVG